MTAEKFFFSRPPLVERLRGGREKNISVVIVKDYTFFCNDIVIIFELRQNNNKHPLFCCHCLKAGHLQWLLDFCCFGGAQNIDFTWLLYDTIMSKDLLEPIWCPISSL